MSVLPSSKTKEYTHICMECIKEVKALGEGANEESWRRSLCKIPNTSNGENHIRSKHINSPAVREYFDRKKASSPPSTIKNGKT